MEIRYLGFDQQQNSRVYRFDVQTGGKDWKQACVVADIAVFRNHRIGIQDGPVLSGNKLTADLERGWDGDHELTAADVRAYADDKATAEARRAGARKAPRRKFHAFGGAEQQSPGAKRGPDAF